MSANSEVRSSRDLLQTAILLWRIFFTKSASAILAAILKFCIPTSNYDYLSMDKLVKHRGCNMKSLGWAVCLLGLRSTRSCAFTAKFLHFLLLCFLLENQANFLHLKLSLSYDVNIFAFTGLKFKHKLGLLQNAADLNTTFQVSIRDFRLTTQWKNIYHAHSWSLSALKRTYEYIKN
jgi:hypothetical protein